MHIKLGDVIESENSNVDDELSVLSRSTESFSYSSFIAALHISEIKDDRFLLDSGTDNHLINNKKF